MNIDEMLFENSDKKMADFQAKLTPNITKDYFLGVRVPDVRKIEKQIRGSSQADIFLNSLPHKYFDENMLHAVIISNIKDYNKAIEYVDKFLPFVDNWAVCDVLKPRVSKKDKDLFLQKIREWISSPHTYTCRFGIEMLMSYYLDSEFKADYLKLPAAVISDEYYVNMMIAWFFATALAKQRESTIPFIENKKLPLWVHNKTIQKAKESYRITAEQKAYLNTLKIK